MDNKKDIFNLYHQFSDDEKVEFLYELNIDLKETTIEFLVNIAKDENEYDLARVEAIKILGLLKSSNDYIKKNQIAKTLISLAKDDNDDDVRNYALQSLSFFRDLDFIPQEIGSILLDQNEYILVREAAYSVIASQKNNPESKTILKQLIEDPFFNLSASRDLL